MKYVTLFGQTFKLGVTYMKYPFIP